jgi:hypothetical protein
MHSQDENDDSIFSLNPRRAIPTVDHPDPREDADGIGGQYQPFNPEKPELP